MPDNPTWGHVQDAAAAMTDRDNGVYASVCAESRAGATTWPSLTTMANSFGARWFDEQWRPQLDSPAWNHAVSFYVNLLTNHGPPGSEANSFNEILALMNEGKCGMWIDATIAASFVTDPGQSKVADKSLSRSPPVAVTSRGANWLWAWALAVPSGPTRRTKQRRSSNGRPRGSTSSLWPPPTVGIGSDRHPDLDLRDRNFLDAALFAEAELKGNPFFGGSIELHAGSDSLYRRPVCCDTGVSGDTASP